MTPLIDHRAAAASIDSNALQENLNQINRLAPKSKVLVMIKADAYGHGIKETATALHQAQAYGVTSLAEAFTVRQIYPFKPIVLMSGFFSEAEIQSIFENDFSITIHSIEQVMILKSLKISSPLKIWLKIDTGMHRLGFLPEEVPAIITALESLPFIVKPFVIFSHFACADQPEHPLNPIQLNQFLKIKQAFPHHEFSLANSAAIMALPQSHFDWIRPGIMLYGISPFSNRTGQEVNLIPAMEMKTQLIEKKFIRKNETVGYGATWTAAENTLIGVIAIGYGDGYPRHAQNGTPTLIRGKICPLIGRVSMDFSCVDLTNCPNAAIGDEVTLWGKHLPIERIAEKSSTIAYELVTNITRRVKFYYRSNLMED